ncbi:MAG: YfiR family protein [Flavobacteriales bacterium]|nr:YfiR family protein [Flavobacteriales bacterium]
MLFIPKSYSKDLKELAEIISHTDTLLVSECYNCAKKGSAINLDTDLESSQVKIEINKSVVDKSGIKLSSKIYSIAKIIN